VSHLVRIQTQVKDAVAVGAACQRLGLPEPVQGAHRLFSGEVSGLGIQLPEWIYPLVCDTASGELRYDNFNGRWGDPRHLDRFLQAYAVCKATSEARRQGHSVCEQSLPDGSIKLTVQVAGGAGS